MEAATDAPRAGYYDKERRMVGDRRNFSLFAIAEAQTLALSTATFASAVAALLCVVAGAAVQGQTGPSVADDRAAVMVSICRQYAAALTDMPADLMFKQCMSERHCRPIPSPPGYWCEPPQPMQVKPG